MYLSDSPRGRPCCRLHHWRKLRLTAREQLAQGHADGKGRAGVCGVSVKPTVWERLQGFVGEQASLLVFSFILRELSARLFGAET